MTEQGMKLDRALRFNGVARKRLDKRICLIVQGGEDLCFTEQEFTGGFKMPLQAWTNARALMDKYGADGWAAGWTTPLKEVRDET